MAEGPQDLILTVVQELHVKDAPDEIRMSLPVATSDLKFGLQIVSDYVTIGTEPDSMVTYRITGWDSECAALILRKVG